jgi:ADP-heptose:LPS heptosyltransferase
MGDLLMSTPAIAALKESFQCKITVLTSTMAKGIASLIPDIDDVIIYDVPWVKSHVHKEEDSFLNIIAEVKARSFDACVVFTVFSQNPLPSVMIPYLAGIPLRLAYCRENPYELLTDWVPDEEPYSFIRHQVRRDLDLVATIGASTRNEKLRLRLPQIAQLSLISKIQEWIDLNGQWVIIHPGVSEEKRQFPEERWIKIGQRIASELNMKIIVTGSASEQNLCERIAKGIGAHAYSLAGALNLSEFIALIDKAPLIISVNTGTIHVAAAMQTKTIVLYALTNPQHAPWRTLGKLFPFPVPEGRQSKNEVLRFLNKAYFNGQIDMPSSDQVFEAVKEILVSKHCDVIPELVINTDQVLA